MIGNAAPYQGFNRLTLRLRLDPERRKHFINLFIWPTTPGDSKEQRMVERQGYHLVHWIDGDFTYWAVSDVSVGDLQNFQRLFEKQTAAH
jgi:anti-sigma factor RsiW